jgi:hypothetical protein
VTTGLPSPANSDQILKASDRLSGVTTHFNVDFADTDQVLSDLLPDECS